MNLKKLVAKTLIFAMAMTFVPAVNMGTAKAAKPATVKFDGAEGTLTSTDAKFWGIAKKLKDDKKANLTIGTDYYLVTGIEEFVGAVDVSAIGSSKDTLIALGTSATLADADWSVTEIPAQDKNFVVAYFATKDGANIKKIPVTEPIGGSYGYLGAVTTAVKGQAAAEVKLKGSEKVEVKNGNGSWKTVKEFFGDDEAAANKKLHMLTQRGATLTFRIKAENGKWASKETKVKVTAQAKAPNAKVDPVKSEVGLKKGMEYRIGLTGAEIAEGDKWQAADKKMTLAELKDKTDTAGKIDGTKDATIEVRTKATTKKVMSKTTTFSLKKQDKPTLVTAKIELSGAVITDKLLLNVKTPYDIKKGAELVNKDKDHDYEVYIAQDGAEPAANAKWTKVKAPKDDKKPTKVSLKYSASNKPNTYTDTTNATTKIYVRVPGSVDKKTGVITMASPLANVGLQLKNVEQAVTVEGGTGGGNNEIAVAGNKATAIDKEIKITIANVTKAGSAKVKVTTALANVAVKAGKVEADGKCTITVKATNKAFTEAGAKVLKFTVSYEGATKEIIVNYNIT